METGAGWRFVDSTEFDGRRKAIGAALGVSAFGINRFDSQPGQAGKEHDESGSGQEEVYLAVEGSGLIRIGADEIPLTPGRFVLVEPLTTRQVIAGPDGLSYVVAGVRPGSYPPRG